MMVKKIIILNPRLPSGINFNNENGLISEVSNETLSKKTFTITGINPNGSTSDWSPYTFTSISKIGDKLPRHKTLKSYLSINSSNENNNTHHCVGALIKMNNSFMISRNKEIISLQSQFLKDSDSFNNLSDFEKYHDNKNHSEPFFESIESFLLSEHWLNFIQEIGDDNVVRKAYKKIQNKPKCKGCGYVCSDLDSYYETYHNGILSGGWYCIYCCEKKSDF